MLKLKIALILLLLSLSLNLQAKEKNTEPSVIFELQSQYMPSTNFDSAKFNFSGNFKLFNIGYNEFRFKVFTGYRNTNSTDSYFPKDLYKLGFQIQATGKDILLFSTVDTHTDQLFDSIDEVHMQNVFGYNILNSRKHFLYVGFMQQSRFVFLPDDMDHYPYPYIVYLYQGKNFMIMGPIPFRLNWKMNDYWELDIDSTIETELSVIYHFSKDLSLAFKGNYFSEESFLADRQNANEALVIEGFKAGLELNYLFLNVYLGYAFGQEYYREVNNGYFKTSTYNSQDINDSLIGHIGLKLAF